MAKVYQGATCRGSIALGTACGRCEKCQDGRAFMKACKPNAEQQTRDGYCRPLPSVRRLVDVIGAKRPNLTFNECEAIARDVLAELQSV